MSISLTSAAERLSRTGSSRQTLRWLVALQLLLLAGVIFTETTQFAYLNRDPIMYTLVGEGIYRYGLLPFDYVFDHKPVLLYFVYGPLSFFGGGWSSYALLTFAAFIGLAAIVRAFFTGARWPFVVLILAMAAATIENVQFSGNSEIVYVPLQFLAVGLLLSSAGRPWRFWGAAIATVAAFNTNYISAVPLLPALLYCLWVRSNGIKAFVIATLGYAAACLVLMGGLFAALALVGMDVVAYFEWQIAFLVGYSDGLSPSARSLIGFGARLAPFLCLAALPIVPALRPHPADRPKVIAMLCLIAGAITAFILSNKYHYFNIFMVSVPAVIVFLLLRSESRLYRVAQAGLLVLVSLYYVLDIGAGWTNPFTDGLKQSYAPLRNTVEGQEVLPVRASVVPFYFSGARPAWPFVWHDHIEIIHGTENEDSVYADALAQAPPFVMTQSDLCRQDGADWSVCARLNDDYTRILSQAYTSGVPGFTVWQRGAGDVTTDAPPME